jgi:hypothetical protein
MSGGGVQWAQELKRRAEAGERLTPAQRALYRIALQSYAAPAEAPMRFEQIPCYALPPGMRVDHDKN